MKFRNIKSLLLVVLAVVFVLNILVLPASALSSTSKTNLSSQLTWEEGYIDPNTGANATTAAGFNIRTQNKVDVSDYNYIELATPKTCRVLWYKSDGTFIKAEDSASGNARTIPVEGAQIRITMYANDTANLSDSVLADRLALGARLTLKGVMQVSTNQIDTSKTGNLKIYKYEMNDTSAASTHGLGYDSEKDNVPSGATPLDGVTFEIKRVVAIDTTGIYYYDSLGTKHDYTIYSGIGFTDQTLAQMVADFKTYKPLNDTGGITSVPTRTQTTTLVGSDHGVAQFTNLPLGIYLVQEKNSPAQVTKKVDDFVVSIPRMSTDRMTWLYSTSVFPKNETVYKSVKIEKRDGSVSGNPLITSSNASFSLAKSEDNSTFTDIGTLTTSNGVVTKTNLPVNCYYRLTETTAPTGYIKDTASNNNVTYFYLDTDGKILSRDKSTVLNAPSSGNPAVITIKNFKPIINKYIVDSVNLSTSSTSAATVDSIRRRDGSNNYQVYLFKVVTPNISSAMSSLKTFELSDTLTNIDGAKVAPQVLKITYGSNATSANANVLSTDAYTFTATQNSSTNTTYNTKLSFDTSKISKNTIYFIYYKVYVKGETTNKATLKYSTVTSGTDTTSEVTSNTVKFIDGSYFLTKTNESGTKLQGAEFKLYSTLEDARSDKNAVFAHDVNYDVDTYVFKSQSDGTVKIRNIDLGTGNSSATRTYYLVETKAPTGYNLLAEPVTITVTTTSGNSSQITVVNTSALTFPLTGSAGILICIAVGSIMLILAFILIINKKRRNQGK